MPPKLKKDASAAASDSGGSVLNRFKAAKEPAAAPAAAGKKSLKAKQALDLDGKGPLHVLETLKAVRANEAKWCRKCADLFDPSKSATQQCPQGHPNFTSVKPAPELKAQLEVRRVHSHLLHALRSLFLISLIFLSFFTGGRGAHRQGGQGRAGRRARPQGAAAVWAERARGNAHPVRGAAACR